MQKSYGVMEPQCGVIQASRIIGEFVEDRRRVRLGRIHNLVIDPTDGRLAYAVLSFGDPEAAGCRLFAVPWRAFDLSATGNRPVLDVDRQKLENAPAFRKDARWPDFADRTWGLGIHQYYGCGPYWDHQERPQVDRRLGVRGPVNPTLRARAGAGGAAAFQERR